MRIGKRIVIARMNAGLTQADLARKLNVTAQTISAWERGVKTPKLDTICRICNAIGCDTSEILSGVNISANAEIEEHRQLCPLKKGPEEARVCDKERCAWYFPSTHNCAVTVKAALISGCPREDDILNMPILR